MGFLLQRLQSENLEPPDCSVAAAQHTHAALQLELHPLLSVQPGRLADAGLEGVPRAPQLLLCGDHGHHPRQLLASVPRVQQALGSVQLVAHGDQPDIGEAARHWSHRLLLGALYQQCLPGCGVPERPRGEGLWNLNASTIHAVSGSLWLFPQPRPPYGRWWAPSCIFALGSEDED